MHIAVGLNPWGDIIVYMILWHFCKSHHQRTPELVPVSNLKLLKHVFNILSLRLSLRKHFPSNPR